MSHYHLNHHDFFRIPNHWRVVKFADRKFIEEHSSNVSTSMIPYCYFCADCDYSCSFLPLTGSLIAVRERPAAYLRIIYGEPVSELSKDKFIRELLLFLRGGHTNLVRSIIVAAKLLEINGPEIEAIERSAKSLM